VTKEKIKQKALALFVKNGYDGTSMSNIANCVNIRAPSIYAHFENKEALFLAIFQDVVNEKLNKLDQIKQQSTNNDIKELLQTILTDYLEQIETARDKTVFFKRNSLFPPEKLKIKTSEILKTYEKKYTELLIPAFTDGVTQGILRTESIDKLLTGFYCLADGLYVLSHYYEIDKYKKIVSDAWDLFWISIKNGS
jgi:AcrR family transcriptional regulator